MKGKKTNKSFISQAMSCSAIGKFWDEHDLTKFWHRTRPVKFKAFLRTTKKSRPQTGLMNRHVNAIAGRPLSLRPPQWHSLEIIEPDHRDRAAQEGPERSGCACGASERIPDRHGLRAGVSVCVWHLRLARTDTRAMSLPTLHDQRECHDVKVNDDNVSEV
jgi:hypothetical protein